MSKEKEYKNSKIYVLRVLSYVRQREKKGRET